MSRSVHSGAGVRRSSLEFFSRLPESSSLPISNIQNASIISSLVDSGKAGWCAAHLLSPATAACSLAFSCRFSKKQDNFFNESDGRWFAAQLLTAVYTAYLFAQAKARDLWQNPLLLPPLRSSLAWRVGDTSPFCRHVGASHDATAGAHAERLCACISCWSWVRLPWLIRRRMPGWR